MNISEAVGRAMEGDGEAISFLYEQNKNGVYYICRKFMDDAKDAGVVLQYTFFQAFHKLSALKNPDNFGMWLSIIASNRCRTLIRSKNADRLTISDDIRPSKAKFPLKNDKIPVEAAASYDPDTAALACAAADRLPETSKTVLLLYFFCRMNPAQIAKIFESSEAAAKAKISEAYHQLGREISSASQSMPAFSAFSLQSDIGTVFAWDAMRQTIPPELSESIIMTSATLAVSASGAPPLPETADKAQNPKAPSRAQPEKQGEKTPLTEEQRSAIRNAATIFAVVLLAAAIIAGSIFVIKRATESISASANITESGSGTKGGGEQSSAEDSTAETGTSATTEPNGETTAESANETTVAPTDETTAGPAAETTAAPVTDAAPETEPPAETQENVNSTIGFESLSDGKQVFITKYTGTSKEVDIPSVINGKPVTKIAASAFIKNTTLISVKIPASVLIIEDEAFRECTSLTTVTFSPGLKTIGNYAFLKCEKLSSVKIPSTVTSIGATAFGSTAWMTAQKTPFVTAGDGVLIKYLGSDGAVTVPDGVKYVSNAFYYNNIVTSVTLPSGVASIGVFAFCYCPSLKSVTIPDTVTYINKDAIYDCAALGEIKVKSGSYAEKWCSDNGFSKITITY